MVHHQQWQNKTNSKTSHRHQNCLWHHHKGTRVWVRACMRVWKRSRQCMIMEHQFIQAKRLATATAQHKSRNKRSSLDLRLLRHHKGTKALAPVFTSILIRNFLLVTLPITDANVNRCVEEEEKAEGKTPCDLSFMRNVLEGCRRHLRRLRTSVKFSNMYGKCWTFCVSVCTRDCRQGIICVNVLRCRLDGL